MRTASWSRGTMSRHFILFMVNHTIRPCSHWTPLIACGFRVSLGEQQQASLLAYTRRSLVGACLQGTGQGSGRLSPPGLGFGCAIVMTVTGLLLCALCGSFSWSL